MAFRLLQKRRDLALVRIKVEAVLLAAEPDEVLSIPEIIQREWGYRPEDRAQHYDLYHDVKGVLERLRDIGLAEVRHKVGQLPRWRASEEARALQIHRTIHWPLPDAEAA